MIRPKTVLVRQGDLAESILVVRRGQCCVLVDPDLPQVRSGLAAAELGGWTGQPGAGPRAITRSAGWQGDGCCVVT